MSLDKLEIWVHDHILKNDAIRHFVYGVYQRVLYMTSPKFEFQGNVEKLTPDDGYEYLFGYYDKCPWSDDGRYLLALKVKNAASEADSTKPAEVVRISVADKSVEKLAVTHSWNVQQGCMAQWLSDTEILYNDFRDGKYCAIVLNLDTKAERLLDMPVYAMSADRKTALTLDFSRLHRLRPGYGYANITETTKGDKCPDKTCIWKIDIASGRAEPLLKYTDFANFETRPEMKNAEHKVNHLMISPDGSRFIVLHRWFQNKVKYTRLVTCNMDGTDMYNLSDDDFVSHCCWKNNQEILSYLSKKDGGKGYYLMKDKSQEFNRCWSSLVMDGHPTYSYDGSKVVTDTYPDRRRIQSLYVMTGKRVKRIARVFSPFKYGGDTRCDLHPRWSKDGKRICFDASFGGKRSVCVADVENVFKQNVSAKYVEIESKVPIASIIMPCYNAGKFLDETLEGLKNQTRQDFEVVCVNDGSKDDTLSVLQKWQREGTLNIKIVDKDNGGVSAARNDGLRAANGKYVVFLDADDAYHEFFIEKLVGSLEANHADAAYCRLNRNYDNVMNSADDGTAIVQQTQTETMHNLLYRMGEFGFTCYAYRRDILEDKGIFFDLDTKFGEDREFNWKYLCHCTNICFVDAPMYWYRVNNQSATGSKASWRKTDLLQAVKRIEKYLEDNKCVYSQEFNSYMYARAMWAVAKTFSVSKDKELYNRLCKEYDVKTCMKRTAKDGNQLVKIASWCYLIHPGLFYKLVGLKG